MFCHSNLKCRHSTKHCICPQCYIFMRFVILF
ncbi:MAG: hypothetical protein IIW13_03155 [Paludibacteraceae bacterium]|nr:hypothetical protein [Paludibacteraceae bacterium]MBQ5778967.1 hypothetical protein [Paludibacteraceae bacterium]